MTGRLNELVTLKAAALAILTAMALAPATTLAAAPQASLTQIEGEVMCVSCRESLAVAQSPQAYAERAYIRALIAQGKNKQQIEQALVAQYGPAVLAKPPARGFNLSVYVLPPAILLLGLTTLALTLPRWRRRTQSRTAAAQSGPPLDPLEQQRLDHELAHFDG